MRHSRPARASCHRSPFRWTLCVGLILCVAGCQSDAPKNTEDHRHFEQLVEAVDRLRAAYETQDLKALHALRSPSAEADLDPFERDAEQDFAAYDAISLALTIERIYVRDEQATVTVRWSGTWQHGPDDTMRTDRGYGTLVWSGREAVLLERTEGNLPFGIAGR